MEMHACGFVFTGLLTLHCVVKTAACIIEQLQLQLQLQLQGLLSSLTIGYHHTILLSILLIHDAIIE